MSNEEYLKDILRQQRLPNELVELLRNTRERVEQIFRSEITIPNVRYYYAGSYKKETMIRESFDLDFVIYFPPNINITLREIYLTIYSILERCDYQPHYKNVSIRCFRTYQNYGDFHIDIVPGRAIDNNYYYANLYKYQEDRSFKTSIEKQVEVVLGTGRRDIIKLLKLWQIRRGVPGSTFILELLFIRYLQTLSSVSPQIEPVLLDTFEYIRNNILNIKLVDPANSNNIVSDDLTYDERVQIQNHAQHAINAKYWSEVFER